jgi:hypothetical protein
LLTKLTSAIGNLPLSQDTSFQIVVSLCHSLFISTYKRQKEDYEEQNFNNSRIHKSEFSPPSNSSNYYYSSNNNNKNNSNIKKTITIFFLLKVSLIIILLCKRKGTIILVYIRILI